MQAGRRVSNGGVENALSSGIDSGTTVSNGGTEVVFAGGIAGGVTVDAGGAEYILAGGTGSGTTLSGGAEVVSSGGVVSGTVTFVSWGTLFVNDGLNFGGTLVGFNSSTDILDLVNVPYLGSATVLSYTSTGVQSGTDIGTLSVINSGGVVANVALLGNYIAGSADFIATLRRPRSAPSSPIRPSPSQLISRGSSPSQSMDEPIRS